MARHKVIVNDLAAERRKKQITLAKKRKRLHYAVQVAWSVLVIAGIIVSGFYQEDQTIEGVCFIAMGIVTVPLVAFLIYTESHGWRDHVTRWLEYGEKEDPLVLGEEYVKRKRRENLFEDIFVTVLLSFFCIGITIFGICRLLGIM